MMLPEYAEKYKSYILALKSLEKQYRDQQHSWRTKADSLENLISKITWPDMTFHDDDQSLVNDLSLILSFVDLDALQKEAELKEKEWQKENEEFLSRPFANIFQKILEKENEAKED